MDVLIFLFTSLFNHLHVCNGGNFLKMDQQQERKLFNTVQQLFEVAHLSNRVIGGAIMQSTINPNKSSSLSLYRQSPPEVISQLPKFQAATVQLLVQQPVLLNPSAPLTDAGTKLPNRTTELANGSTEFSTSTHCTGDSQQQFGPQYRFNDGKKMASGPVWELDTSIVISGVDYAKWPLQLSTEQLKAYYESGRATILNTTLGNPAVQQDSSCTIPSLELLLPENATKESWNDFFFMHPERVVEDALVQAFGTDGARYLRDQLDQFNPDNEQVQQWKEISKMLSAQKTCSFPYVSKPNSPREGSGKDIILEMMFIQDNELRTNQIARDWRVKMGNFLKNAGIDGDLAYKEWRIINFRGFNAANEIVDGGSVQYFLTVTQARQLFTALRSFVTGQVSS